MELNKIYNQDCLDGMKTIKDKSVDMILCDLPYGTTKNKWDSIIGGMDYFIKNKMSLIWAIVGISLMFSFERVKKSKHDE